jgi:hypothetical protein
MEAILKFNLPDDQDDFDTAVNGAKWWLAMYELNQYLRSKIKYSEEGMSDDTYKALEETRDQLYKILQENSLKL